MLSTKSQTKPAVSACQSEADSYNSPASGDVAHHRNVLRGDIEREVREFVPKRSPSSQRGPTKRWWALDGISEKHDHRPDHGCAPGGLAASGQRWRRVLLALPMAMLLTVGTARSEDSYSIDQTFGSMAFSVSHLGLFSSQGQFRRFGGNLLLDTHHPEWTKISVDVDATSVDMPSQESTAMLQSPDFFDVRQYPIVHFKSTSVEAVASDRYLVRGLIEIRGVTQPLILDAKLVGRHRDAARGADVAEFVVNGTLQRSAFGMTADKAFISDKVAITIKARIQLSATFDAR
jgi:polyisoprenoid-binding protein YceI